MEPNFVHRQGQNAAPLSHVNRAATSQMSNLGKPERETQNRVVALFRDELAYRYLGDWSDRSANANVEEKLLGKYLGRAGYSPEQISRAIYLLTTEIENPNRSLYDNSKAVYSYLRYGVPVKIGRFNIFAGSSAIPVLV